MDSTNHFVENMLAYLSGMDEEYLIAMTNKGIFKRAIKDLESGASITCQLQENAVQCVLPDGNSCTLTEDIKAYTCTCPSRNICKHVVMSYWYIKQHEEEIFGCCRESQETEESDGNYEQILSMEVRELKKRIGEKAYWGILHRINFGVEVQIEEAGFLTVRFPEEDIFVKFPKSQTVRDSICSCKSSSFCVHRAEAVLHYQMQKKAKSIHDLIKSAESFEPDKAKYKKALRETKSLIWDILFLGLSRLPDAMVERVGQAAVYCHNADLPNLEKRLRDIGTELTYYFQKHASFSLLRFRHKLTEIYQTAELIGTVSERETLKTLVGEHKTSYYDIPPIELYGVGAGAWQSQSGYEGITYYFFSPRLEKWLTYTVSRPTFYEDVKTGSISLYKQKPPWNLECSCEAFSKSHIRLVYGKLSENGRLSATEQCRGEIMGRTEIEKLEWSDVQFDCWETLLTSLAENWTGTLTEQPENFNLCILTIAGWGKSRFDEITQTFYLPVYDSENREAFIALTFSPHHKRLIEKLERMERMKKQYPDRLLGKVYIAGEKLTIVPIAGYYDGQIVNLTLD